MDIYLSLCVYIHTYTYMHACMHACMHRYIHTYCICVRVCIYTCLQTTNTNMYIVQRNMKVYVHKHSHTRTRVHILCMYAAYATCEQEMRLAELFLALSQKLPTWTPARLHVCKLHMCSICIKGHIIRTRQAQSTCSFMHNTSRPTCMCMRSAGAMPKRYGRSKSWTVIWCPCIFFDCMCMHLPARLHICTTHKYITARTHVPMHRNAYTSCVHTYIHRYIHADWQTGTQTYTPCVYTYRQTDRQTVRHTNPVYTHACIHKCMIT